MPTTFTPLRYPGGKSKYAPFFRAVLEDNNLKGHSFAESFAGGAGASISLLVRGNVEALVLNDLDPSIYAFWKSVTEQPSDLIKLIRRTPVSVDEWHRQREVYSEKGDGDTLTLGFATFFLNRCNHSGILGARPIGGLQQRGTYRIDSRYTKETSIAKIQAISKLADRIEVHNMDGIEFIGMLADRFAEGRCLLYLDPPYYQKGPELYLNHFTHGDHLALRDTVKECALPWVLSYDNHPEIVSMYRELDCHLYVNTLRHTISGNTPAEELIITKLNLPKNLLHLKRFS